MSSRRRFLRHGQPAPQPREWPPGDTKTTLVADLEAKPESLLRDRLIEQAKRGRFHDTESDLPNPKRRLREELHGLTYFDLAQKVLDGAYNETPPRSEMPTPVDPEGT